MLVGLVMMAVAYAGIALTQSCTVSFLFVIVVPSVVPFCNMLYLVIPSVVTCCTLALSYTLSALIWAALMWAVNIMGGHIYGRLGVVAPTLGPPTRFRLQIFRPNSEYFENRISVIIASKRR